MKRISLFLFLLLFTSACESGPKIFPVAGAVTLDGNPVGGKDDAVIRFETTGATGNSSESFINNGQYLAKLTEGNYKVSVTWNKKTGKTLKSKVAGPGQESEEVIQIIPVKYGSESALKVDIKANSLRHDFQLKSK